MSGTVTAPIHYAKEKLPTANQIGYTVVESQPYGMVLGQYLVLIRGGLLVLCPTEERVRHTFMEVLILFRRRLRKLNGIIMLKIRVLSKQQRMLEWYAQMVSKQFNYNLL